MTRRWRQVLTAVGAVALLVGAHSFYPACLINSRRGQLKCVIDHNVGWAHFTRGMNQRTIEALREHVTADDLPVLMDLCRDEDIVTLLTASRVLACMGEPGTTALTQLVESETSRSNKDYIRINSLKDALTRTASCQSP